MQSTALEITVLRRLKDATFKLNLTRRINSLANCHIGKSKTESHWLWSYKVAHLARTLASSASPTGMLRKRASDIARSQYCLSRSSYLTFLPAHTSPSHKTAAPRPYPRANAPTTDLHRQIGGRLRDMRLPHQTLECVFHRHKFPKREMALDW